MFILTFNVHFKQYLTLRYFKMHLLNEEKEFKNEKKSLLFLNYYFSGDLHNCCKKSRPTIFALS